MGDFQVDLDYALKQLRGVSLKYLNHAGQYDAADRVQRALDALGRIEEEIKAEKEETELNGKTE